MTVREYLPFIVIGLATGSVYALAAMGLTVTYVTSGVFNFAHGAVGMISAYAFYSLREESDLATPLAFVITILVVAPVIGLVIDRWLFSRLRGFPTSTYVVASLGLLVTLQGIAVYQYGGATKRLSPLLADGKVRLPGVNVGYDQLTLMVVAVLSGTGLWVFLRLTHLGLQTRAVVDDPDLTELVGTDTRRLTAFSWMLGSSFAALSGVLLSASVGLNSVILTLLVVQAFGAAAVGRFTSLPFTYLGALIIGVGAALSTKFVVDFPQLIGVPSSLPFIVLFVVLVVSPRHHFQEVIDARELVRERSHITGRAQMLRVSPLLVLLLALPWLLSGPRILIATATLIYVLVFRSLGLLVGLSRQVSMCHAAFLALGATTMSHLSSAGFPFLAALLLSALLVVPAGALVAIPAIRLSGLFLALATLGYGLLLESLVYPTGFAFGKTGLV
jgi:branched-subunit amino acid ABC-type transport system permease component